MNKLKTLKDMDSTVAPHEEYNAGYENCKMELKVEAIKWIKELRTYGFPDCEDGCCAKGDGSPYIVRAEGDGYCIDNVENWIFDFFNLTEEDLL